MSTKKKLNNHFLYANTKYQKRPYIYSMNMIVIVTAVTNKLWKHELFSTRNSRREHFSLIFLLIEIHFECPFGFICRLFEFIQKQLHLAQLKTITFWFFFSSFALLEFLIFHSVHICQCYVCTTRNNWPSHSILVFFFCFVSNIVAYLMTSFSIHNVKSWGDFCVN